MIGLLVAGAASIGFGFLAVRDVDYDLFLLGLRQSDYRWTIPAVGLVALAVYLRALRWRLMFRPMTRPGMRPICNALLIGYLGNQILPFRAGEAARVLALHREAGTSRAESFGTAVAERLYDIAALLVLLFAAVPFLPSISWIRAAIYFSAVFLAVTAVIVASVRLFGDRPLRTILRPLERFPNASRQRVEAAARNLNDGLIVLQRPRTAVVAAVLTLVSWLVVAAAFWLITIGFHLGVGFAGGLLVMIATNLALVLPSLPAGIGVFEAATIVSLSAYGIGGSEALSCAVVIHALNFFPVTIAGFVALHRHLAVVRRRTRLLA